MKLSAIFFTCLISFSALINAQNYSLNFDGIDDYVEIPFNNIFNIETNLTIEAFVKIKPQSFLHNSIVSKNPNDGWGSGWELAYAQYNADNLTLLCSPGGTNSTTGYPNPLQEKWYHIAAVYDGTKLSYYLDGESNTDWTAYVSGPIASNTLPIVLGRRSEPGGNTHFLNGYIESVKYSNVARYNTPFTPPTRLTNDINTIGLWNIDEGTGNIIYDESGNGNNGVIYGATWSTDVHLDSLPHLNLQSPNGGESWVIGQQQNITWSNNLVENIKIEYSPDNGNTWLEIIDNVSALTGSYLWTLPNVSIQQCKVKITDISDPNVFDISNQSFQILNDNGLVTFYPFNGNANDESGNGYNGVTYGATPTTDRFGNPNSAYSFDGIDDYIELSNTENLNFITGGFTLAAWVNYTENKEMAIINKHTYYDIKGYGLHIYPAPTLGFFLHMDPANGISTPGPYNDGNWHFVVGTYANSLMKLYVDGQFVGNLSRTYNQFNNVTIKIGKFSSNPDPQFCYRGKIDDIRIFNRELTSTEILNMYQANVNIQTESVWQDTDYNGYEIRQVSGEGSSVGQGDIIRYDWFVNGEFVDSVITPSITLNTGTNILKLVITSDLGTTASDSTEVTVYCTKTQTNGAIYSGISEYEGKLFFTSVDKGVYRIDSTGTLRQSYLTGGSIQSTLCISSNTNRMYVGSSDTRLYCFDSDLNSIWDKGIGGVVNSSASVTSDGSILFVGTNDNNLHIGYLKALNASDGTAKWTFQADGEIISSPVLLEIVDGNNIVIQKNIYFGTKKGTIYSIEDNGNSYSTNWSLNTSPDSAIISTSAVSSDGYIYIGSRNGYLYRVRWDGEFQPDWKVFTGGPVVSSPIIDELGNVYISSASGYVYGFPKNFVTGTQPVKQFHQNDGINGSPAFGLNGSIIVGSDNGKVYSLNKNTAGLDMAVNWALNTNHQVLAPSYVSQNGLLYIGTTSGDVYVVKDYGTTLGKIALDQSEWPTFKGNNQRSKVVQLSTTGIASDENDNIPNEYNLAQNYPNPFNPSTSISYSLPMSSFVQLKVFNLLGQEVITLVNEERPSGNHQIEFNASNLPSGVYLYKLQAGDYVQTRKMILLK